MRADLPRLNTDRPGRRLPRALLWAALVALLLVAQTLLVALTVSYESSRAQERADEAATQAAGEIRQRAQTLLQGLQALQQRAGESLEWRLEAGTLMRSHREMARIERRDAQLRTIAAVDSPFRDPLFARWPRAEMELETEVACSAARRSMTPVFSRSQFVPQPGGLGVEMVDVCVPLQDAGQHVGYGVASIVLSSLLEELRHADWARSHELSFVEADGTRLARAGAVRGAGVYVAERVVDLAGTSLQLRVDAAQRRPSLIPNLATALVLGLSLGLFAVVLLLVRDGRRRARAEDALAEALAFRRAMEDSLLTGLRARDRDGHIVYVNPAFCHMVGFSAQELQESSVPLYWPPEQIEAYQHRQAERLAPGAGEPSREGYETVFMRKNGERFPVMVYEAPLVDRVGAHTGWMGAVLDLSAQRKVEDLSRQQQERLQATARLASVGEMASLLSHELNQPLAAIASYATGSLNLIEEPAEDTLPMVQQALQRIAEQAERAGRVIKSVHDFVRRRHQAHEVIAADALIDSVLPLIRLQARKSGARIELDIAQPVPRVKIDRTMLEQVLLNLARNGLQAMERDTPLERRVLILRVQLVQQRWAAFSIVDAGPGIAAEVGQKLFTPFFTTRDEGMGLGLSLCRTVVEQHGGAIDYENLPRHADGWTGTVFRFTLPLAVTRASAIA
ncbi:two-component system sensor histidine kinase NtrB [Aquabacterium sp.]|uniref:two-component system sensor histidine kinase NtrB n=1 Tax=Aquabacterium sp. TaxID=1872578 RepID=UPI002C2876BC|nr:ATP-binding protein [Aquabacterium sp.]HSW03144.1 ATP-binding protein [Aquabacterium sp.]